MEQYEKIRPYIGVAAIIFIGVMMIMNPDAVADADASGRRSLLKGLIIWIWGIPTGVIFLIIGGVSAYNLLKKPKVQS